MIIEIHTWQVSCDACPATTQVVAAQFELPPGWTEGTERGLDEVSEVAQYCPTCSEKKKSKK